MAKVRITPNINPVGGVREDYKSKVYVPDTTVLGEVFKGIGNVANVVAEASKAQRGNDFAKYKQDMDMLQKDAITNMGMAVGSDQRKKIANDYRNKMARMSSEFKWRNSPDVANYNDTFFSNYEITTRGLSGKMWINEQRDDFLTNINTIATGSGTREEKMEEFDRLAESQRNVTLNDSQIAKARQDFNLHIQTRSITTDETSLYSDATIENRVKSVESITSQTNLTDEKSVVSALYKHQREQIMDTDWGSDEVRDKMYKESERNESIQLSNLDKKFANTISTQNDQGTIMVQDYINAVKSGKQIDPRVKDQLDGFLDNMVDDKRRGILQAKLQSGKSGATTDNIRRALVDIGIRFDNGDIDSKVAYSMVNKLINEHGKDMSLEDMTKIQSTLKSIRDGNLEDYTEEGKNMSMINNMAKDPASGISGMLTPKGYSKDEVAEKFADIDDDDDLSPKQKIERKNEILVKANEIKTNMTIIFNSKVAQFQHINKRPPSELERMDIFTNQVVPEYTRQSTRRALTKKYTAPSKTQYRALNPITLRPF